MLREENLIYLKIYNFSRRFYEIGIKYGKYYFIFSYQNWFMKGNNFIF